MGKRTEKDQRLTLLGNNKAKFCGLETFLAPRGIAQVTMKTDEVTALCPVTGQPDWYEVVVVYSPREKCIESKSFKLYIQSFRETGSFCEALAAKVASDVKIATESLEPVSCVFTQKPRGGVSIRAEAVV